MRRKVLLFTALLCGSLLAQEGHPMRGTWHGSWGPNANDRTSVTLVMDFDGDNVTGQMNPGLRSVPLQKVTLDPNGWKVHLEADYKDRNGAVSHVVIDGKIDLILAQLLEVKGGWKMLSFIFGGIAAVIGSGITWVANHIRV